MADATVVNLKSEPPTEASASRDAIGALLDRLCADVLSEVEQTERSLRALSELALTNTAAIKAQLANMVDTAGAIKAEVRRVDSVLADLRAEHVRLIDHG